MDTEALVLREQQDRICYLTLNRPQQYNALSLGLMRKLIDVLSEIAEDKQVNVVVIKGAGRGFCAGHDLKEMTNGDDPALQEETFQTCSRLMMAITKLPQPVIAQVHGIATAAGCQLVATCDLAVTSNASRFATPGVNIGLFCSTPMVALTRTIAPKHAMEMLLLGETIDAQRAYEIGLVNRVVSDQDLETTVNQIANQIASKSSQTLAIGKAAFHQQLGQGLEGAYEHCSNVMSCNMQEEDAKEGIDAFINKRQPVWKGR